MLMKLVVVSGMSGCGDDIHVAGEQAGGVSYMMLLVPIFIATLVCT